MKTIFCCIFLLLPIFSFAQITLEGVILNEKEEVIPYANIVVVNTGIGILSKDDGSFLLTVSDSLSLDTLEVSYLGYESQYFIVNTILDKAFIVELEKSENLLNEVVVTAKNAIIVERGNDNKGSESGIGRSYYDWDKIYIVARFIDNDKNEKGFIYSVSFFLNKSFHLKQGHQTPFRIRIYSVGKNGNPEENILVENIIVQAKKKNRWNTFDISEYNIPIPENGFFVGMEWLVSEDEKYKREVKINYINEDGTREKRKEIAFGQGLGLVIREDLESTQANTWILHGDRWQRGFCLRKRSLKTGRFICHEAMIKATLEIYPD